MILETALSLVTALANSEFYYDSIDLVNVRKKETGYIVRIHEAYFTDEEIKAILNLVTDPSLTWTLQDNVIEITTEEKDVTS